MFIIKNAFDIIDQNLFLDSYKNKSIGLKILINNKNKNPKKSRNSYGLRPFGKYADVRNIKSRKSIKSIKYRSQDL